MSQFKAVYKDDSGYNIWPKQHNNRLKEAYIIFTMGIAEGFFGCNCHKPEWIRMLLEYKCGTKVHMHKKFPEITTGDPLNAAKTCFVFFCHQYNMAFRKLILHWFWPCLKRQMWIGVPKCTSVKNFRIFTARCYASAVLAVGLCLSVCLCPSVTSRCSTKTAKRRITQTTPHDSPGTLVFWCQTSPRNSTGVTPCEGAECRWGGQNRRLSTNNRLYLENGTRQTHSFY